MKHDKFTVKVPFKAGRLDAKGTVPFRNKKRYTRKTKHPNKSEE